MKFVRLRIIMKNDKASKFINIEVIQEDDSFELITINGDILTSASPRYAHCSSLQQAKNKAITLVNKYKGKGKGKGFELDIDERDINEEYEDDSSIVAPISKGKPKLSIVK